jgi:ribonuclease Z
VTTDVIITGTGNPAPAPDRAGPGVLIRCGDVSLQFDAGRGTVQRLAGAGQPVTTLTAFFATHHHSDHLTGLADLVLTRWVMDRVDTAPPLPIIVPAGPCELFVERMLDPWDHDLAVRRDHMERSTEPGIELIGFPCPREPTEVWSNGDVRVLAGQVRHEPVHPAVGYRIETPDGVIAISGDTLVCDEVALLAEGADVLIYEAMRFSFIASQPSQRHFIMDYHADTPLIGEQAAELGVPTLMLTHLIPPPITDADRDPYVADIRAAGYEGNLMVCDDLDSVTLG